MTHEDDPNYYRCTREKLLKELCEGFRAYQEFGSYQGRWFAAVQLDGKRGFLSDYYGSCSGCDDLEGLHEHCDKHWRSDSNRDDCPDCKDAQVCQRDVVRGYFDAFMTYSEAMALASKDEKWDSEAPVMMEFVTRHKDWVEGKE